MTRVYVEPKGRKGRKDLQVHVDLIENRRSRSCLSALQVRKEIKGRLGSKVTQVPLVQLATKVCHTVPNA